MVARTCKTETILLSGVGVKKTQRPRLRRGGKREKFKFWGRAEEVSERKTESGLGGAGDAKVRTIEGVIRFRGAEAWAHLNTERKKSKRND